jgi:hypothetical protein
MTFYAKPTNRPLALEGWFEKLKNRLFGHVRVNANSATLNIAHLKSSKNKKTSLSLS